MLRSTLLPAATTLMPLALRRQPSALKLALLPDTVTPLAPLVSRMPVPLLWWALLLLTTAETVPRMLMPGAVWPLAGRPAPDTVLPVTVMWSPPET
jgi:hypothetical protein